MMRRIGLLILVVVFSCAGQSAWAGSRAERGFVGGALGGALLGQAIGRNTEATLVGTAVGGVLGYVIANEHDRAPRVNHTSPSRREYEQPRYTVPEPVCREAEVMAYVEGRPQRVFTTVCLENGEWVVAEDMVGWERTSITRPGWRNPRPRWERHQPPRPDWCNNRHCDSRHRWHDRDCHRGQSGHNRPHGGISVEVRAPLF